MMALPLAGGGALWSLWVFDVPFDLYGGIGIVLLCGIVAKNSILIVDLALQKVREGKSALLALEETVPSRVRPIVMTSIAMIVGMLPIATGWGVAGSTRQSLGIAAVGGVISSTVLSLLLIPSLFLWVESGLRILNRTKNNRTTVSNF
jgi:multidrug efflux pump subunit AcrB